MYTYVLTICSSECPLKNKPNDKRHMNKTCRESSNAYINKKKYRILQVHLRNYRLQKLTRKMSSKTTFFSCFLNHKKYNKKYHCILSNNKYQYYSYTLLKKVVCSY